MKTNDDYWDCECEEHYIHNYGVRECTKCGARFEDSPSSHQNEIDEGTHFADIEWELL